MSGILTADNKILTADNKELVTLINPLSLEPDVLYSTGRMVTRSNNSAVVSVPDFSLNNVNAVQATEGDRGIWNTNIFGNIGGITANAATDRYSFLPVNYLNNVSKLSFFCRYKTPTVITRGVNLFLISRNSDPGVRLTIAHNLATGQYGLLYREKDEGNPIDIRFLVSASETIDLVVTIDFQKTSATDGLILIYNKGKLITSYSFVSGGGFSNTNSFITVFLNNFSFNSSIEGHFGGLIMKKGVIWDENTIKAIQRRVDVLGYI